MERYADEFANLIDRYRNITIVSHINPDADTIGTALGLYAWLKEQSKQVEVVNASEDIALHLDYIPYFSKIKRRIDFQESLIISCDCGSIDRLGFDVSGRDIINIDHHASNEQFGMLNIVDSKAVCTSEVMYGLLRHIAPISKDSAIGFYAALISDTLNFTTANMHIGIFELAAELVTLGADIVEASTNMTLRRSLASVRILAIALDSIELSDDGKVAVMKLSEDDMLRAGAKMSDVDGLVDYARSLATVKIGLIFVEEAGRIKVSIRSKDIKISELANEFGGGGHHLAGGFSINGIGIETLSAKVLAEIKHRGLIT